MGAYSELKDKYDNIAADYFVKKGYTIRGKGGKGGAYPDVVATKGSTVAYVEVKSPAEGGCGDFVYKTIENKYLGGIERKTLLKQLSPLLNEYRGLTSLVKLYIATITHQMYSVYNNTATDEPNKNHEIYLCTPLDNKYKAATHVVLSILESLGLITIESTDKHCIGDDCLGVYQIRFHDMPKEQTEQKIKKLNEAKASNLPKSIPSPSSLPSYRSFPRIPIPAIPIDPQSLGIMAGVVVAIILVWWLYSHFPWTNFSKKEEAAPISTSATIPKPTPLPEPASVPEPTPIPTAQPVFFQFDKYDINAEAETNLVSLAEEIKKSSAVFNVNIDGYTCSIGSASYNLKLSERRANSIKSLLIANGISSNSVRAIPHGIAPNNNETEEGRIKNRRADISVSKPDKDTIASQDKSINTNGNGTVSARDSEVQSFRAHKSVNKGGWVPSSGAMQTKDVIREKEQTKTSEKDELLSESKIIAASHIEMKIENARAEQVLSKQKPVQDKKDVIVAWTFAIIRSVADNNSALVTAVKQGDKLTVISELGKWLNVRLEDGREGWISNNVIK